MRHYFFVGMSRRLRTREPLTAPLTPPMGTRCVRYAPPATVLVASGRFALGALARRPRTVFAAVNLAPITVAAQQHRLAAACTQVKTRWGIGQSLAPQESILRTSPVRVCHALSQNAGRTRPAMQHSHRTRASPARCRVRRDSNAVTRSKSPPYPPITQGTPTLLPHRPAPVHSRQPPPLQATRAPPKEPPAPAPCWWPCRATSMASSRQDLLNKENKQNHQIPESPPHSHISSDLDNRSHAGCQ